MLRHFRFIGGVVFFVLGFGPWALAQEYFCEVMTVKGEAFVSRDQEPRRSIREGDILKPNDFLEVGPQSHVDLAYDSQWNNLSRLEEGSRVTLLSIYPTGLSLEEGGVFARLNALPKHSTFEVQTPTAIASVRGSVYRTVAHPGGRTQVFNFSKSSVYVFGVDAGGNMQGDPVELGDSEKSEVGAPGEKPSSPGKMSDLEFQEGSQSQGDLETKVLELQQEGRLANIQSLDSVLADYSRYLKERLGATDIAPTDPLKVRRGERGTGQGRLRKADRLLNKVAKAVKRLDKKAGAKRDQRSERHGQSAAKGEKGGKGKDGSKGGRKGK